jgi:thiol-disulfide isomerase/thioredoxin
MANPLARAARRLCLVSAVVTAALAGAAMGAQEWRLPGLDGGAIATQDVAAGTTAIVVWAGWSPHCRDVVERSNALAGKLQGKARVVLVDFQEEASDVKGFLADKGGHLPVFLDGDGGFAKAHRVMTLPGMVVYRDGAVAYQGKLPEDPASVVFDATSR